jgi:signal transduction histidine kinase
LRTGGKSRPVDASAISLLGAKKILAVHHSAAFLKELSVELAKEGFTVVAARSGTEALGWLEKHTADCIVLDATRAEFAACDTCRIVKSHPAWRLIPLLLLTATARPQDAIEGLNSGADDCVPSVAGFVLLRTRVRVQLRRKQFEDHERSIREQLLSKELQAAQARAAQEVAEVRAAMVGELEKKNRELDAFAHSVSHDLRSPLRTIRGFTQALLDDFNGQLPSGAQDHLVRVIAGALRMGVLIDALLELSRTSRADLRRERFDLSHLARLVVSELDQERHVECSVEDGIAANGDPALISVVLDNLLGNAWKFTAKTDQARVAVGALPRDNGPVFFVRDNGAGFDSAHAPRLFQPFERLHPASEFPGTGIGLATVRRIVERHGGEIWAESSPGAGATFFFTLPES